jgi:peptidoglycan/LPS O-acetylase OafA/YrhL
MLSGFVLAWSDTPQTARRFWWLRFARIWPLQFLLMIFAYTAIASHVKSPGPLGHVAELLLLQAWFPGNSTYAGGNGVTWSLSVEMFFYLVFPLAIVLLRRLRGRGLAVTAAVTLGLMAILPLIVALAGVDTYSNLYYWLFFVFPPYRFGEFLLGMVLARAMIGGLRVPAPARTALAATAGVAGLTWAMTAFTVRTGIPVVRPMVALLAIPFFALLLCASATRDQGGHRALRLVVQLRRPPGRGLPASLPGPDPDPLRRPALPGGKARRTPPAPDTGRPASHRLAARGPAEMPDQE